MNDTRIDRSLDVDFKVAYEQGVKAERERLYKLNADEFLAEKLLSYEGSCEKNISMNKLIYGVGYNSKGGYKTSINGKPTKAYRTWNSMMRRCYDLKSHDSQPAYSKYSVAECWHDYQVFADWFYRHPYSDMNYELDKDILFSGNKIYSPSTCCFLPRQLNGLLTDSAAVRGKHPQGVCFSKSRGVYLSRLRVNGKLRGLGSFSCPNEAYQIYKTAKERHVKNKALEWANRIEWNAFNALMKWSLSN